MSLYFFEGPAGSGKTSRVFEKLERTLEISPLGEDQRVLALTKMHGSRRRIHGRLASLPRLRRRFSCFTVDSFAWQLYQRWRSLARNLSESEPPENDFEQVCRLAGALLAAKFVQNWVASAYPVVVIDEMQDSKGGQLEMVKRLAASATCIAAADDFQDLEATEDNMAVEWAREVAEVERLTHNHRTSAAGLLATASALREGNEVPEGGRGFKVLGARNANVGASFVSKSLTWWSDSSDIAVLTPVRAAKSDFVRCVLDRVEEGPISNPPVGPHHIPWEESQEDECARFIADLELPNDPTSELYASDISLPDVGGPTQGLRRWFEHQRRVAGRMKFTAEEVRHQARRIHQRSRAYRRVRERGVRAMTIHQAKNREFDSVIVLWPYEIFGSVVRHRRLLYNAITRASRQALVVVQNPERMAQPPFVAENHADHKK